MKEDELKKILSDELLNVSGLAKRIYPKYDKNARTRLYNKINNVGNQRLLPDDISKIENELSELTQRINAFLKLSSD